MNSKKKVIKLALLMGISLSNVVLEARQLFTPLSSGFGTPYANDPYRYYAPQQYHHTDELYECTITVEGYGRGASQSYTNSTSTQLQNLSALFHRKENFLFPELFADDTLKNCPTFVQNLDNVLISPRYEWNEQGCIIGGSAQKSLQLGSKECRIRFSATLPFKQAVTVKNVARSSALSLSNTPATQASSKYISIKEEQGVPVFAARLDALINEGIITMQNPYEDIAMFCTSLGVRIGEKTDNTTDDVISIANISNGNVVTYNKGTLGYTLFNPNIGKNSLTYVDEKNIEVSYNGTSKATVPISASINPAADSIIIPLQLVYYTPTTFKMPKIDAVADQLFVMPQAIEKTTIKNDAWYIMSDVTVNKDLHLIEKGDNIQIAGYSLTDGEGTDYPNFDNAPVAIQRRVDGTLPPTYGIRVSLGEDLPSDDGSYSDFRNTDVSQQTNFLAADGSFYVPAGKTINPINPAVFWYGTDYTLLPTSTQLSQLYLTTSLMSDNAGKATAASENIYKRIEAYLNKKNAAAATEAVNDLPLAAQVLAGWFRTMPSEGTTITAPEKQWQWNEFSKSGIGDLDMQLLFGTSWEERKFSADALIGLVAPTALTVTGQYEYLAVPLGNNGHFQWRIGGQAAYEITTWARISGYLHYAWALPSHEYIVAPFQNASAYGLQPSMVLANIWWQECVISGNVACFANEKTSLGITYQYFLKRQDNICLETDIALTGAGDREPVSPSILLPTTARRSHKIIGECAIVLNEEAILSFGISDVIAGRNIAREGEGFIKIMVNF